jgi:hypothetical protein
MSLQADIRPGLIWVKAICRVLAHFLDGGWNEIVESRDEEESEKLFDTVESAHSKLFRLSRGKAA